MRSIFVIALFLLFCMPFYLFFYADRGLVVPPYWTFWDVMEYQYHQRMEEMNIMGKEPEGRYAHMIYERSAYIGDRFGYYSCVKEFNENEEKCKKLEERFRILYNAYYTLERH